MNDTLLTINACIGRLLSVIPSNHNLLVVSDHGMVRFDRSIRIMPNDALFTVRIYSNSLFMIECKPNMIQATVDYLKSNYANISVYRKDEIPERWHYGHNEYVTDVIIVADIGIQLLNGTGDTGSGLVGGHGYDNQYERMRPTFIAHGPDIRNTVVNASQWHNVDAYLLMATLVGITPSPNNGSLENVMNILLNSNGSETTTTSANGFDTSTTSTNRSLSIHNNFVIISAYIFVSLSMMIFISIFANH